MEPESEQTSRTTIQSIEKIASILDLFSPQQPDLTLSDMAQQLGWNKPTTSRIAHTLVKVGLLDHIRDERGPRFRLGLRLLGLANLVANTLDVRQEALPYLQQLAGQLGDTCYLLLHRGARAVCVARVPGSFVIRELSMDIGDSLPLNRGGAPIAILAHLADQERENVFALLGIVEPERSAWLERIAGIRRLGYAVSRQEVHCETTAVGAPIFDHSGHVLAAISLGGPAGRFDDKHIEAIAPHLTAAVAAISARLGFNQNAGH